MNSYSRFLSQSHFGSLDGLRALSIAVVIWHHTRPSWIVDGQPSIGPQGVTLFFAISGFLITSLLLRERARNGSIDIKSFYIRRALRIFPLYYGVLALYVILVWLIERNTRVGQEFFENLKYFLTYTSNIFVPLKERVIFYFSWSLAAEEQFYLIWPTVLALLRTQKAATFFLFATIAICVVGQLAQNRFLSGVPVAILAGSLLALLLHTRQGYDLLFAVLGGRFIPLLLAVAIYLTIVVIRVPVFVVHILCAALVGACILGNHHVLAPVLNWKPVAFIGSISYGMYMLHMLCKHAVLMILGKAHLPTDGMAVFVLTLGLAVVAATLSYKYYESYFLALKHRYER